MDECPDADWWLVDDKCYRLVMETKDVFGAEAACRDLHVQSDLAKLEDWTAMNTLSAMLDVSTALSILRYIFINFNHCMNLT